MDKFEDHRPVGPDQMTVGVPQRVAGGKGQLTDAWVVGEIGEHWLDVLGSANSQGKVRHQPGHLAVTAPRPCRYKFTGKHF
jgi:hypothetical protein